jgi:hypothetical protein
MARTLSADSLRPAGGMFEGATGIGASALVEPFDEEASVAVSEEPGALRRGARDTPEGIRGLAAAAGARAQRTAQATMAGEQRITRG